MVLLLFFSLSSWSKGQAYMLIVMFVFYGVTALLGSRKERSIAFVNECGTATLSTKVSH